MSAPASCTHKESVLNIAYAHASGMDLLLDLHVPSSNNYPPPVIVHIHGGAWEGGSKHDGPVAELTRRGYAAACITYRLSSVATFPAPLHDCKAAIRFLRSKAIEFGIDPTRIGVWGESAGGHLAALLGVTGDVPEWDGDLGNPNQPSTVDAICDWFGPTDLCHWDDMQPADKKASDTGPIARMLGGPIRTVPEQARRASPIHHIPHNRPIPPFLIMHGDADDVVPLQQSTVFADALTAAGHSVTHETIHGAGHGFPYTARFINPVMAFFDQHLRPFSDHDLARAI